MSAKDLGEDGDDGGDLAVEDPGELRTRCGRENGSKDLACRACRGDAGRQKRVKDEKSYLG